MVAALTEAGFSEIRVADRARWSQSDWTSTYGFLLDGLIGVPWLRSGWSELSEPVGPEAVLIGYSLGGLAAAETALNQAGTGGRIAHLVLIATPISADRLEQVLGQPGIGKVTLIDLGVEGDPVFAGVGLADLLLSVPGLIRQVPDRGHFFYAAPGADGQQRRRELARHLKDITP